MKGSADRSTSVRSGLIARRSEPVLYMKMSFITPVARRVLTRLSPSLPPGRVSISMAMSGFAAMKSAAYCSARSSACGELVVSSDRVTSCA